MNERMLDKTHVPDYGEMSQYCGEFSDLFEKFCEWAALDFYAEAEIRFPYGNRYGWCVSFSRKAKHICNVFPERNGFCVMARKSDVQFASVYDSVSAYSRQIIDDRYSSGRGGWIQYAVRNEEDVSDLMKIISA